MEWRFGMPETGRARTLLFQGATGSKLSLPYATAPAVSETKCLRDNVMFPLKTIFHGKLQDPRFARAGDLPKTGVAQRGDRRREVDVIGGVKSFEADFQPL